MQTAGGRREGAALRRMVGRKGYLRGVRQVVGHTPIRRRNARMLARAGLCCIEPGVEGGPARSGLFDWRYAVIERGRVQLVLRCEISLLAS